MSAPVRKSTTQTADTWLVLMWLLAALSAVGGFIAAGNAFPEAGIYDDHFSAASGLAGAVACFVVYLPWIGLFEVLRALTRAVQRPTTVAAPEPPRTPSAWPRSDT